MGLDGGGFLFNVPSGGRSEFEQEADIPKTAVYVASRIGRSRIASGAHTFGQTRAYRPIENGPEGQL